MTANAEEQKLSENGILIIPSLNRVAVFTEKHERPLEWLIENIGLRAPGLTWRGKESGRFATTLTAISTQFTEDGESQCVPDGDVPWNNLLPIWDSQNPEPA